VGDSDCSANSGSDKTQMISDTYIGLIDALVFEGRAGMKPGNMVLSVAIRYYVSIVTTLTVKVPEALERSIAIAARRERVTKSELIRRAMAKYVAQIGEDHKFQSALDLAGGLIGSVRGGPVDLATNAKYMDDYGR
jgi:Ribbon-helix-helix protein, copG family